MSDNLSNPAPFRPPILLPEEAERRLVLLSKLQSALSAHGLNSILARNHRLVLHGDNPLWATSGLTDPQLHIFAPDGSDIATTDGITYTLASGRQHSAADPAAAADRIDAAGTPHPGSDGALTACQRRQAVP